MRSTQGHSGFGVGGFSLVEALVALVVLSIGLLGIAALYVESLRAGRTALLRTQAVTLATDMSDRIRGNRDGRSAFALEVSDADISEDCRAAAAGTPGCNAATLARHDKAIWLDAVETTLPGGTGSIIWYEGASPDIYEIRITWSEAGQDDPLSYVLRVQV